ncbi:MAG: hydrogenase maturation protease [Acidobacteria bacterium]|nr:hydrogenase maturation protease [Acidobacteriota bacterium]
MRERNGAGASGASQAGCRGPRRSILVAGFGNVLRGDDGFGVEVVRRLQDAAEDDGPGDTVYLEIGTGGIALAQALLTPFDRLVIVDAMVRGGAPGTLYVLEVESVETLKSVDMHMAVPSRALGLAQALGALPPEIYMVGCEPATVDELDLELSSEVSKAVDGAMREVRRLLEGVRV